MVESIVKVVRVMLSELGLSNSLLKLLSVTSGGVKVAQTMLSELGLSNSLLALLSVTSSGVTPFSIGVSVENAVVGLSELESARFVVVGKSGGIIHTGPVALAYLTDDRIIENPAFRTAISVSYVILRYFVLTKKVLGTVFPLKRINGGALASSYSDKKSNPF